MRPSIGSTMPPPDVWTAAAPFLPPQTHLASASKALHVRPFAPSPRPKLALRGAL